MTFKKIRDDLDANVSIIEKWKPRYHLYTPQYPPIEQPGDDCSFDVNIESISFDIPMIAATRLYGSDDSFIPLIETVNSGTVGVLARMMKADCILDPITVIPSGVGVFDVVQGRHRVVKSQIEGKKTIRAKF